MTAVVIFLIVAGIAIVAAALMLISQNAVHSALFLVLNFLCVAFFFLTLGAPFIALVQIAVYAGAIMVLFLFVIMLLGAEHVLSSEMPYSWLPRAALVLALLFLVTGGWALASGQINLNNPPPTAPQVRVINAVDTPLDVYLNNQPFVEAVDFRDASAYLGMPAGDYGVTAFPAGADPATEPPAILGDLSLVDGDVVTLVALSDGAVFSLAHLVDDPTPVEGDQARLTLLNGLADAVDLVDPGLPSSVDDDRVLIPNVAFAEPVETVLVDATGALTLAVQPAGDVEADPLLVYRELELERNSNVVLIPAPETLPNGTERVAPVVVSAPAAPQYGSPQMVAETLYSKYLLPFELVSVLLLAAMVGAIVLTRSEVQAEYRPRRRVVRRPLVGAQAASALAGQANSEAEAEQIMTPETGD